jgi:hypothetical protein
MGKLELRFRQIHLDFHTSEHIAGVGSAFDPDEFAATLEKARVNSVTCFGRCHHGWIYFDTQAFPERRHPHLTRNLLKEQIEACHARDIRVPIYLTVQWDYYTATEHPEWLVVDEQGCPVGTPPYEAGFYRKLCVNSPYVDWLKAHVEEVLQTLPTDGIFFDIVQPQDCSCKYCRAQMEAQGVEPSDAQARRQFGLQSINRFKREMTAFVRQFNQECSIFYNAGHVGTRHRAVVNAYTHFELESLPSGGWGYLHFPMAMRYARNLGIDCMGMTGKFHTSWGDFHSFKNEPALQFECFQMLALGAKCSIGDQLHPSGWIGPHVYGLIGSVYAEVERKEPWCRGATPVTEIGVFTPEEFTYGTDRLSLPPALMGITRMLEEGAHQFEVIDSASDLSPYQVVVLPDDIPVSDELAAKIEAYVDGGGAVIASFESGLDAQKHAFTLKALGVEVAGEGPRDLNGEWVRGRHFAQHDYVEYVLPKGPIGKGLPETELAMYMRGMDVKAEPGSKVLVSKVMPYFDRTYEHFCSHRQTPSSGEPGGPAVVKKGRVIYFAHPIFRQYHQNVPRWCKTLFLNALDMLLPEPLVRHNGPTTMRVTVNAQAAGPEGPDRWVVHLLHYIPERRSQDIDVIEDVIPLYDVKVSIRVGKKVGRVACVPGGDALHFEQKGDRVEFVVPRIEGHQMVELDWE